MSTYVSLCGESRNIVFFGFFGFGVFGFLVLILFFPNFQLYYWVSPPWFM